MKKFSVGAVTKFYLPLMLQAFSQSVTYPLVAGIVTRGEFGVNALTAFTQGLMIMFMIGALGAGLVTTGLIFAKTRYGYDTFRRLNALMMAALLTLQCIPSLPPFDRWVFEGFFALPPDLAKIAARVLLCGTVMNAGFFLRNVPMVVLFNNYESGKANNATILRILVTLALSYFFPALGWIGPDWGLLALTLGVWCEYLLTWYYARPYVAELQSPALNSQPSTLNLLFEQFRFTMPLALGGFLLATSPLVIASFVGRTADAADMLVIHYVTLGVANPVAYGALRMQPVAVKFLPEYPGDRRLLWYAIAVGLLLGVIPLAFATPWLAHLYFGVYQNVPEKLLPTVRLAIAIYGAISVIHAVRARIEGIAAARKRPKAVMAGQIAYTVSLLAVCAAMLPSGCSGWTIAITAIFVAPVSTALTVYASLAFYDILLRKNSIGEKTT